MTFRSLFALSSIGSEAFRFIDAPAAGDGPLLKGAMWYPCWLPQQIEYARLLLGGIVVPVAVDIPVYAGWCISVFYMQRGGDATRLRRLHITSPSPAKLRVICTPKSIVSLPSALSKSFCRQIKTLWPSVRKPSWVRTKSQTLSSAPPRDTGRLGPRAASCPRGARRDCGKVRCSHCCGWRQAWSIG